MKAGAQTDGYGLLPARDPSGPVDYFFICMEPSLAVWAPSRESGRSKEAALKLPLFHGGLYPPLLRFASTCARPGSGTT